MAARTRWLRSVAMYMPAAALVPALVVGVAGLAGYGPRWLRRRRVAAVLVTAGAAAALARWQLARLFTPQPGYDLERTLGDVEIRRYRPRVVAETVVEGAAWRDALDEGFRRLARYIFGANEGKQRIAMTSPVAASPAGSERIAMTAPVTSRSEGAGAVVTFTMPDDRDLASLPRPLDPRVRLRCTPGERFAVLRYRGTYGVRLAQRRQDDLLARVRAAGIEPTGEPIFAGYDPPWTLPFLRRVEAWVPIA